MTQAPVIRLESLTKKFGAVVAVDNISFDVRDNEMLALLGASGCGKTTLLRLIAGLETADGGRVLIAGRDETASPPYRRPVNMMFQSYALFPHMTVAANVAFGLKQDGLSGEALAVRVREALASVEMEAFADRQPQALSGGQQQRVALARCLAKRPRALLLDEPMAALDKSLRERTQLELMALRARLGITFIVVTHDQDEAMTIADRVAVMHKGRILQAGPPRELYERPTNPTVAAFFGDVNLWTGEIARDGRHIECPILTCACIGDDAPLPAAQKVVVAVRPEQISLTHDPQHFGPNQMLGVVTEIVYHGTTSTYFLRGDKGVLIRAVRQNASAAFHRGETLQAAWPSSAVRVLPP